LPRTVPGVRRHPSATETVLVIEVADSSLRHDRTTKLKTYARAGIPTYWIVNIPDMQVEVYDSQDVPNERYGQRIDYRSGQTILCELSGRGSLEVAVADILPAGETTRV